MAFSSNQKARAYRVALRLRLPVSPVIWAVRMLEILAGLPGYLKRRREADRITRNSPWRGFVPKQTGCRLVKPGELPGSEDVVALCRDLLQQRRSKARAIRRAEANPFDMLFSEEVFRDHPALLAFATSPALTEIAADYFGTVPRLEYIDLWVSRPEKNQEALYNSQLYHIDKIDQSILTLFLAVEDIDDDSGPFTLLPAAVTERVSRATNYARTYLFGSGRLTDDEVLSVADPSEAVSITGPAGAGGFCDTGRCLHFGSRCQSKERVVLVIRYYSDHQSQPSVYRSFTGQAAANTPGGRLLLAE